MIPVTKPFMPPIEEYQEYVKGIWERGILTNNGPLVKELEQKLKEYLDVPNILYLSNGTIALQIAIKALGLTGDVITTPFSYVATTSSLVWEGCNPVFVDIDPNTLNIDPNLIEAAITPKTTGILATHVFGNPCDIDAIQFIADKHGLKVIYDAAHCFGTKYRGRSVFEFGDISTTSFHATKLFHTIEGGAVFTKDSELHRRMSLMRNFGHAGFDRFDGIGINGKSSEFHAAMGIINLGYIGNILEVRRKQVDMYFSLLNIDKLKFQSITKFSDWNYSYMPIIFESVENMLETKQKLEFYSVFPRRYFYPSLNKLDKKSDYRLFVSERVSNSIICLPLYNYLSNEEIEFISRIIKEN